MKQLLSALSLRGVTSLIRIRKHCIVKSSLFVQTTFYYYTAFLRLLFGIDSRKATF